MAPLQEERRSDSVAISRQTFKAITWVASLAFSGVAWFVWDSGSTVRDVRAEMNIIELRVQTLEGFARAGDRFTAYDGRKLEQKIEKIEKTFDSHIDLSAHREQKQLNREIFWRIQKLEKPNTDNGN